MSLRILLHNLRFLSSTRLEEMYFNNIGYLKRGIMYGKLLKPVEEKKLKILNSDETLDLLLMHPKSFYRFGDGEINLMTGGCAGTQENHPELAKKLKLALTDTSANAYIGIGYDYFDFDLWSQNEFSNRFYLMYADKYREFYLENCSNNYTYIDTGFSQKYFSLSDKETHDWFMKLKLLFRGKNISLFMGEQAYKNLDYYIFDEAGKITLEFCASKNAFSDYEKMMEKARMRPKSDVICLAVGATAKVMAYELTKEGYIVYDIGHMPKDYDSYMKKVKKDRESAEEFYLEDYRLK